uniref:uncharacterized protein LOC124073826 n=1 Tax=Scatophagus argus TaxID=75038 RepID=UPI001ED81133|nr:uncharacterized protein LOC124073826 [Scatophagus argus]
MEGLVAISESDKFVPVRILRDTAAAQSLLVEGVLPLSEETSTGENALVRGCGLTWIEAPLHVVYLQSGLVTGSVAVAIRPELPVEGVDMILGNDLAGGEVFPTPIVVNNPVGSRSVNQGDQASQMTKVFPACVVTRAQSRKVEDVVDLSEMFIAPCKETVENVPAGPSAASEFTVAKQSNDSTVSETIEVTLSSPVTLSDESEAQLKVGREQLVEAQKADPSLAKCVAAALPKDEMGASQVAYYWEDGILMRKWAPSADDSECNDVHQIVVPAGYRAQILSLAHDNVLSGHLGIAKTYYRILKHFFWPGLKRDVSQYCHSCHTCQLVGKPNQVIPQAPLHPIPVMGEPFERLLIDCVGPLPKSKSGHQFLLTLMCAATRYPEAIPLRSLKAKVVVKELMKFCTTFGLPKVIQTDQGTNFMSKVFSQVLEELAVKHQVSSAYHPESQGALERFHQTLKTMLRAYCLETGKEWDEGIPFLLFAVRETVQESLGFSPAELVFGHTVRGPLKLLREQLMGVTSPVQNVLDYVSSFRERLHHACEVAKESLSGSQSKMKAHFDKSAVRRSFKPEDPVLVFLPIPASVLQAKFTGPYVIEKKLSETDYVIRTPDRRRKTRVCHVNMLKPYCARLSEPTHSPPAKVLPVALTAVLPCYSPQDDDLVMQDDPVLCARLSNSQVLSDLENYLCHLSGTDKSDILKLIESNHMLFSDVPTQTTVLQHDIDVGDCPPIKQHAYRVNPTKRAQMQKEVEYLQQHDLAVPSSSAWSSPCLLVPKSDGTSRFCTDFRKPNAVTKPDSFPLPRIEDCIDRVGAARYVTKLDLLKGYWQCLQDASLTLNLAKCEFAKATITYLGKKVGQGQVRPVDAKITAIAEFPVPTTKRELRRFLGLAGYYRGFCRNFAAIVSPLTDLLSPTKDLLWDTNCELAFQSVKAFLSSSPVLSAPNFAVPFKLEVDASGTGAGAVLLQEDSSGIDHPVCYFSKKFSAAQRRYSTIEKEALAMLWALQHFEAYVGSTPQPVLVFTDHNPLVFLSRMYNHNQRLMRWALMAQNFNIEIRHKKGCDNVVADALSRVT